MPSLTQLPSLYSSKEIQKIFFQAANLVALDTNGLSDPFVVVELLLLNEIMLKETRVVKATLNPVFDDFLEL